MLDKNKYLKRVIIGAWISLLLCLTIKIFGGNFFDIMCHNEKFIAICTYADNNLWAYYLINVIHCFISLYIFDLAILGKTKYKNWQLIVLLATVVIGVAIKIYSSYMGWIFDIWQSVFMPMLFLGKDFKKYLRIPISIGLLLAFQILSMITKNLSISPTVLDNGLLIGIIYSFDIIIMEILYFLYSINKKEKE